MITKRCPEKGWRNFVSWYATRGVYGHPRADNSSSILDVIQNQSEYKLVNVSTVALLHSAFLGSTQFEECTIKACVSSLARWRYLRELERDPTSKDGLRVGEEDDDSDDDFEHVSGIAMYHMIDAVSLSTEHERYILILYRKR